MGRKLELPTGKVVVIALEICAIHMAFLRVHAVHNSLIPQSRRILRP